MSPKQEQIDAILNGMRILLETATTFEATFTRDLVHAPWLNAVMPERTPVPTGGYTITMHVNGGA